MLNTRPVELLLGGEGQEVDSSLPDSWTAIKQNDMLISSGHTGLMKSNHSPDTGPRRLASIQNKINQWHLAWIEACQDRLFMRDFRWVPKSRNLKTGDVVWMTYDSKLQRKLKWAIVTSINPDHDVVVRYILLKPGPEPYISAFSKKSPFKTKLCSVQSLTFMYSKEEQIKDMEEQLRDPLASSSSVDMAVEKRNSTEMISHRDNLA